MIQTKSSAALLSVFSNALLIALKLAAAAITGSIAILTEAIHSSIDLMASFVALISVRRADVPPDEDHPYGHEKAENLAATIEGMLILVGAGIIIFEATRRLATGAEVESLGIGIAVIALLGGREPRRLRAAWAAAPRASPRPRSRATPRTCARTRSPRSASSPGLVLVEITDEPAFDAIAALGRRRGDRRLRACRIMRRSGQRPDGRGAAARRARPDRGDDRRRTAAGDARAITSSAPAGRARGAGSTSTSSSENGTSLERAHEAAHELRDAISAELPRSDVLIHVEPESSHRELADSPLRHSTSGEESA